MANFLGSMIVRLGADVTSFKSDLGRANAIAKREAEQLERSMKGVGNAADRAGRKSAQAFRKTGRAANGLNRELDQTTSSLLKWGAIAAGGAIGAQVLGSIVRASNQMIAFDQALQAATGSASEAERAFEFVRKETDRLGVSLQAGAASFAKLKAVARGTSLTAGQVRDIFIGINETSRVLNLSADDVAGAFRAIEQTLSKGKVQAEELRGQLGERLPGAFQIAAQAMGVTSAELSKQMSLGNIYAEELIPKMVARLHELYGAQAQLAAQTPQADIERFKNALFELKAAVGEAGVLAAVAGGAEAATAVFKVLGDNIEVVKVLLAGITAGALAKFVIGLQKATLATIAEEAATKKLQIRETQLALNRATHSRIAAAAKVRRLQALKAEEVSLVRLVAAEKRLAAAKLQEAAASRAATAAAATRSVGFGATALAAVGGIPTLVIGGLTALGFAIHAVMEAEEKRDKAFKKGIESYRAQAEAASLLVKEMQDLEGVYPALEQQIESFNRLAAEQAEKLAELRKKRQELAEEQLRLLRDRIPLNTSPRAEELKNEIEALLDVIDGGAQPINAMAEALEGRLAPAVEAARKEFEKLDVSEGLASVFAVLEKTFEAFQDGRREIGNAQEEANDLFSELIKQGEEAEKAIAKHGKSVVEIFEMLMEKWKGLAEAAGLPADKIEAQAARVREALASVAELEALKNVEENTGFIDNVFADAEKDIQAFANEQAKMAASFNASIQSMLDQLFPLEAKLQELREMEVKIDLAVDLGELDPAKADAMRVAIANLREELLTPEETFLDRIQKQLEQFDMSPLERQIDDLRDALQGAFGDETKDAIKDLIKRLEEVKAFEKWRREMTILRDSFSMLASAAKEGSDAQKALAIAAETTNAILGVQAVLKQLAGGDVWTAIIRAAAVAAIVASLGVKIGSIAGSGGSNIAADRQRTQGTGSVLGDPTAKSESIANAMEIVAGATTELVGINRAMLFALRSLHNAIADTAVSIAQGAGNFQFQHPDLSDNIFESIFLGGTEIVDQGIQLLGGSIAELLQGTIAQAFETIEEEGFLGIGGGELHTSLADVGDEINTQFQLILESIVDTVEAAAVALGFSLESVQARIAQFQIEAQKISLKDMTLEEQQAAIQAVFSKIFDDLAGFVIPWIDEFQRAGEGLGETLVRVATSVQVMQEAVRRLGFSAERVDPHQFAQISVALIELAGGIEEFISQMQSFLDAFAPDAHLFQVASSDINRALAQLGIETIPKTREEFFALMQSFDATTEEGRQAIATLLSITDAADTFYSRLEELRDELENINDAIRELAIAGRDFQFDIAQRIANITGDTAGLLDVASNNLDAARVNLMNATDPAARMAAAEQFISRVATWLQVATQRIQSQIQALEAEANEILERGRARGQAAAQVAQAVAQAQQQRRQAELESVNAQLEAVKGWMDVLDGVKQLMDDLRFSRDNPASGFSRLQMLNARIAGMGAADTPEEAAKIQELLEKRLDLGQQLFQRPSREYQQLFNDTMTRLAEMRDKAKSFEEVITDLQEKANELQQQTAGAVSAGTSTAIILSSAERARLQEIRDEQEALRAQQQAVNDRAVAYYEWAADVYAAAQQARHDELVAEANRIQALLGPDSFIVRELQDIEDAVLGLGNNPPPAPGVPTPGPTPGPGPGGPRIPENQPQPITNNVVVNFKSTGNNRRDAKQMATFIKRELETA